MGGGEDNEKSGSLRVRCRGEACSHGKRYELACGGAEVKGTSGGGGSLDDLEEAEDM